MKVNKFKRQVCPSEGRNKIAVGLFSSMCFDVKRFSRDFNYKLLPDGGFQCNDHASYKPSLFTDLTTKPLWTLI